MYNSNFERKLNQIRDFNNKIENVKGKVFVTKMPCMHPGDV